jgi:hypothetical protein
MEKILNTKTNLLSSKRDEEDTIQVINLGENPQFKNKRMDSFPDFIIVNNRKYNRTTDKGPGTLAYKCFPGDNLKACPVSVQVNISTLTGNVTRSKEQHKKDCGTPILNKIETFSKQTTKGLVQTEWDNKVKNILSYMPIRVNITKYDFLNPMSLDFETKVFDVMKSQNKFAVISKDEYSTIIKEMQSPKMTSAWFILTASTDIVNEDIKSVMIAKIIVSGKHEIISPIYQHEDLNPVRLRFLGFNDTDLFEKILKAETIVKEYRFKRKKIPYEIQMSDLNNKVYNITTSNDYIYVKHIASNEKGTYLGSSLFDRIYALAKNMKAPILLQAVGTSVEFYKKEGFRLLTQEDKAIEVVSLVLTDITIIWMIKIIN